MRIAYLSPYSPENIHYWSGTPHHIYKILQQYHDVKWIGEGMLSGAFWHHRYLDSPEVFYPEYYQREMGRVLSETINADNFDIVLTSYSLFCTYLEVNIPIIAFSDVTFYLYKDFFTNKNTQYHQIAIDTEKRCLERVDAMLYASEWAKADSIRSYNIDPNKLYVSEFGANIPLPKHYNQVIEDMSICNLLFVGRNWKNKGGPKVLEAYNILKQKGIKCTLTIVGSSPSEEIKDNNITIIPWLDKSKKEDLYRYEDLLQKAHFMVLPTTFDAFGIVFCEASAYGVPSIAANVGGVHQPIKEGKNGFLLPDSATANDYAYQIHHIWSNQEKYNQLRITTRKEYETRLNWQKWYESLSTIMENLIAIKKKEASLRNTPKTSYYLPVYAINLPQRIERRKHLEEQFAGKTEFELTIVNAAQHKIGAVGLWQSIVQVVRGAQEKQDEIIIICEDDHTFTPQYNKDILFYQISAAYHQKVELLNGGIGGFGHAVSVGEGRYWVDWFYSTQFIVIYSSLFQKILDYKFHDGDTADGVLSKLTTDKQVLHPFISTQKNFGYSDVTKTNHTRPEIVEELFSNTSKRLDMLSSIQRKYQL